MGYENIYIGKNVYIGPGAFIMAKGGLRIGDNVIIGPKLTVWTENHNFKSEKMIPYDKDNILKPVIIESNVWIGLGVNLCPGAKIGYNWHGFCCARQYPTLFDCYWESRRNSREKE